MGANCVASTSIGCLVCCRGCNVEKVKNAFTFVPPKKSYTVEGVEGDKGGRCRLVYSNEPGLDSVGIYREASKVSEVFTLSTSSGSRIPVAWIKARPSVPPAMSDTVVVLHCHGNATDLGMMMGPYYELSRMLGVDVLGMEYSGYGASSGSPSERNTYADLDAAYDFLIAQGVSPNLIVAYGQSVGTGPVARIATRRHLGGIVLHSPLMSGIKVIDPNPDSCCRPSSIWRCFDFYPNYRHAPSMKCPALIMHGKHDDIIPVKHGLSLQSNLSKAASWPGYFPAKGGHNDLVEVDPRRYYGELANFFRSVTGRSAAAAPAAIVAAIPKPVAPLEASVDLAAILPENETESSETAAAAAEAETDDFMISCAQPLLVRAGPEDGRYEAARRGGGALFHQGMS